MQDIQKIDLYKKRDFGEKINATFAFLRQNFQPLGRCLLFIAGPLLLITGIISGMLPVVVQNEMEVFNLVGGGAINGFLSLIAGVLVVAVVHVYLDQYVKQADVRPIEVAEVWEGVKKIFFPFLLTSIVIGIVIVLGFMFLVIPGFILMAALSLIYIIMTRERLSFGDAFSRCFKLVGGNYLSTLLLIFVIVILQLMLGTIIGLPAILIIGFDAFFSASGEALLKEQSLFYQLLYIIAQIINTVCSQFLTSIPLLALAFQYGNLIEKKESTGLMQDIQALGDASRPSRNQDDETY
ncbi:MAG: hypothetical protein RIG62_16980 [Cyclobacteriaceae bacterium]